VHNSETPGATKRAGALVASDEAPDLARFWMALTSEAVKLGGHADHFVGHGGWRWSSSVELQLSKLSGSAGRFHARGAAHAVIGGD
jgi:hypothetical protein